ncbi:LTA synthase family protein [Paenibacillus gansuensis]|uniref:LTA synthase family protein n=1 Tax=Paenibacillus gansuensis TaxID=306542 RepID=A0ABW5PEF1_9BACL
MQSNFTYTGAEERSRFVRAVSKIRIADYLIFIVLLFWKIILFDAFINVPQVKMGPLDWLIGLGSILLLSFWVFFLPLAGRILALFFLNLAVSVLFFSDLVYFRYFQDFISIPVLMQSKQVGELGGTIETIVYMKDIFFFVDLVLLIPLGIYAYRRLKQSASYGAQRPFPRRLLRKVAANLIIFTIGYACVFAPVHVATSTWAKGLFTGNWWNVATYNVTGLLGFHGLDVYRFLDTKVLSKEQGLTEKQLSDIRAWFSNHERQLGPDNPMFAKYKGKNIIVVQAEALQNFMIGKSIGGKEITPNMNALLKETLYFSNYYHQTGQGRTSDADFLSNCSMHPLPTGSVFTRFPSHTYDCLPQQLKSAGYSTAVFHAYEPSFWNRYTMYPKMGYDRFYSKQDFQTAEKIGWSIGDEPFLLQSADYMKQMKQPFYSFLITLSSHHPFAIPKDKQELDTGEFEGTVFGNYLQSVHYVDQSVGAFVAKLKQDGLWDNSIFLLYGDHDNSITDQVPLEKFLGRELTDVEFQKLRGQVPMILHLPGDQPTGEYKEVAGQSDMTPTLLNLLGLSSQGKFFMGNNLFGTSPERLIVFRNHSFTDGSIYYYATADQMFETGTCTDYATGETVDLARCKPGYDEADKRLNLSDQIIIHDAITAIRHPDKQKR